jgi:putative endonuclease
MMMDKVKNTHNRSLGKWGEEIAADFLLEKGYSIVARNWKSPYGEVDLIVRKADILAFVEVKTRSGRNYGWPEEAITPLKQEHLVNSAETYLDEIHAEASMEWQIDVIAILAEDLAVGRYEIKHYENAVAGL